jgi:hypothetical protein
MASQADNVYARECVNNWLVALCKLWHFWVMWVWEIVRSCYKKEIKGGASCNHLCKGRCSVGMGGRLKWYLVEFSWNIIFEHCVEYRLMSLWLESIRVFISQQWSLHEPFRWTQTYLPITRFAKFSCAIFKMVLLQDEQDIYYNCLGDNLTICQVMLLNVWSCFMISKKIVNLFWM